MKNNEYKKCAQEIMDELADEGYTTDEEFMYTNPPDVIRNKCKDVVWMFRSYLTDDEISKTAKELNALMWAQVRSYKKGKLKEN